MKPVLLSPLAAIVLGACSHLPQSIQDRIYAFQQPCQDCVTFIITRDPAPKADLAALEVASCPVRVLLDGSAFADLHPGERADGYVAAGAHTIGALPRVTCGEAVEAEVVLDQRASHYNIRFDSSGAVQITASSF